MKGGVTFTRADFPRGVFVVMVVKGDDEQCTDKNPTQLHQAMAFTGLGGGPSRMKTVNLMIERKITEDEYLIATFGALAMFVTVYVLVLLISCVLCIHDIRAPQQQSERGRLLVVEGRIQNGARNYNSIEVEVAADLNTSEEVSRVSPVEETEGQGGSSQPKKVSDLGEIEEGQHRGRRRRNGNVVNDDEDGVNGIITIEATVEEVTEARSEDSSIDLDDLDLLPDADLEKDIFRTKTSITVSDLARKSPRALARKSNLYHWNLATIAVFYGLPVVQLMVTYQEMSNSTGNQDLCFYNFLCAHPLGMVTDFNHLYSNLGYVLLGGLFMFVVLRRDRMHQTVAREVFNSLVSHLNLHFSVEIWLQLLNSQQNVPFHLNLHFNLQFRGV